MSCKIFPTTLTITTINSIPTSTPSTVIVLVVDEVTVIIIIVFIISRSNETIEINLCETYSIHQSYNYRGSNDDQNQCTYDYI